MNLFTIALRMCIIYGVDRKIAEFIDNKQTHRHSTMSIKWTPHLRDTAFDFNEIFWMDRHLDKETLVTQLGVILIMIPILDTLIRYGYGSILVTGLSWCCIARNIMSIMGTIHLCCYNTLSPARVLFCQWRRNNAVLRHPFGENKQARRGEGEARRVGPAISCKLSAGILPVSHLAVNKSRDS